MQLSPLNFRGLIATLGIVGEPAAGAPTASARRREAIQCWRCPECLDVHDYEDDAEDFCADVEVKAAQDGPSCPVCAERYDQHRHAADCCLWKDLDAWTRWKMADAVEAGSTWAAQLGVKG